MERKAPVAPEALERGRRSNRCGLHRKTVFNGGGIEGAPVMDARSPRSGTTLAAACSLLHAAIAEVSSTDPPGRWSSGSCHQVNPTLQALPVTWRHVQAVALHGPGTAEDLRAEPGDEVLLIWRSPGDGRLLVRAAAAEDLLALKLVVESITAEEVAAAGSLSAGGVEAMLARAANAGIILAPRPLIRRADDFPRGAVTDAAFFTSGSFTLQWHLTQTCDLHCRHCYDRSARASIALREALGVLDDLQSFCSARQVQGAVSLSGGNPLLHPDFTAIYRAVAERDFGIGILGNPAPRARIEELVGIRTPDFFQVSLEGLPEHNDWVRGAGHFERTERFLRDLRGLGVSTMVMLTLTERNLDQVLPLAARLRGLVDDFHFNRLAMVGEGAQLRLPSRTRYARFLEEYLEAAQHDPALGVKDNLINIQRHRRGEPLFGGCTGFGCGAAFNFVALLPDGEAHACRKFPSPIGNVVRDGLAAVYDSPAAQAFRSGCAACSGCAIRPVCGGCLAVAHGFGLDPLRNRDPLCFLQ
jgi:selenobiotic family peptide radical SAM maturase